MVITPLAADEGGHRDFSRKIALLCRECMNVLRAAGRLSNIAPNDAKEEDLEVGLSPHGAHAPALVPCS